MKHLRDERIISETNKILSPMYFLTVVLFILSSCIKWKFTKEIQMYILEILIIPITLGYMLVSLGIKGILFSKVKDEYTLQMKRSIIAKCYGISLWILVLGEFVMMFIFPEKIGIVAFYSVVWMIPTVIITIYVIKKGLFIWGGKTKQKDGIKRLKKAAFIGAVFFGIIMGAPFLVKDHRFNPWGFLQMAGMAVCWGMFYYWSMKLVIRISEKKADQEVRKAEHLDGEEYEKYKDENS